jgi:hypothetical protein
MTKAEQAAFFNTAMVADFAASPTTDKIREEPSGEDCEVSLQLIFGYSIISMTVAGLLPLDFGAIVVVGNSKR